MMRSTDRDMWPRPCEIESSGFFARGWCLTINADGRALVEHERGSVSTYDLFGSYSIKFTDRGDP